MTLPGAFFFVYSLRQGLGIIVGSNEDRHLEENRAVIKGDIVDKMHRHGALSYFTPVIGGHDGFVHVMSEHSRPPKPRQGSRVYIDGSCGIEPSNKLQPPGAHDEVNPIFFNECPVTLGIERAGPMVKRNPESTCPCPNASVWMVGNDRYDFSVKDRRISPGKLDQFLETRTSPPLIATRKN